MVTELARAPLPPLPTCDEAHFLKCMRTMLAVLPKRATDELSGELLTNTYRRMLGDRTQAEISFLTEQVIARCKWFPTVAECREILDEWVRNDAAAKAKNMALIRMKREEEARNMDASSQRVTVEEAEAIMAEFGIKLRGSA